MGRSDRGFGRPFYLLATEFWNLRRVEAVATILFGVNLAGAIVPPHS